VKQINVGDAVNAAFDVQSGSDINSTDRALQNQTPQRNMAGAFDL